MQNGHANASIDAVRGLDKKQQPGNTYHGKVKIGNKYNIIGFISSGTYGRVYKAMEKNPKGDLLSPTSTTNSKELYAIKKFVVHSQSSASFSFSTDSSRRKKGTMCSIRDYHNLPFGRCLCVQSCLIPMLSTWLKSSWKTSASSWCSNTVSMTCSKSSIIILNQPGGQYPLT